MLFEDLSYDILEPSTKFEGENWLLSGAEVFSSNTHFWSFINSTGIKDVVIHFWFLFQKTSYGGGIGVYCLPSYLRKDWSFLSLY